MFVQDSTVRVASDENWPGAASGGPGLPEIPPRFRLLRELGRGGMAVVYHAQDVLAGREVALKFICRGGDLDAIKRFRREATDLAAVYHPNIVDFYSMGEAGGHEFIEMEYVAGGTLRGFSENCASLGQLLRVFAEICSGLEHIHQRGMIHRDIKPANILVSNDGHAKISDLGLARRSSGRSDLTEVGTVMGTAAYLAPEQIMSHAVGSGADLYALGITLFEAVTGQHPFGGAQSPLALIRAHLEQEPPRASSLLVGLPPRLDRLIASMLAKDPLDRPASATQVRQELEMCAGELLIEQEVLTASSPAALLEKAKRHLQGERPEEALSILARLPAIGLPSATEAELMVTRARALEMQRDEAAPQAASEAVSCCQQHNSPLLGLALLTLGKALLASGDPSGALAVLQRAREAIPSSDMEQQIELMELMARILESGRPGEARAEEAARYREFAQGLRQRLRGSGASSYNVVFAESSSPAKRSRRWETLVAAACLLLTLGLAASLPQAQVVVEQPAPFEQSQYAEDDFGVGLQPGVDFAVAAAPRARPPASPLYADQPSRPAEPPEPRRIVRTVKRPAPMPPAAKPVVEAPKPVRVVSARLPQPDYKLAAPRQAAPQRQPQAREVYADQTMREVMAGLKPGQSRVIRVTVPCPPNSSCPPGAGKWPYQRTAGVGCPEGQGRFF